MNNQDSSTSTTCATTGTTTTTTAAAASSTDTMRTTHTPTTVVATNGCFGLMGVIILLLSVLLLLLLLLRQANLPRIASKFRLHGCYHSNHHHHRHQQQNQQERKKQQQETQRQQPTKQEGDPVVFVPDTSQHDNAKMKKQQNQQQSIPIENSTTTTSSTDSGNTIKFINAPFIVVTPNKETDRKYNNNNHNNSNNGDQDEISITITRRVYSALQTYHTEGTKLLHGLSQALELAMYHEEQEQEQQRQYHYQHRKQKRYVKYSQRLQQRIEQTSKCFEHNEVVLRNLLLPLDSSSSQKRRTTEFNNDTTKNDHASNDDDHNMEKNSTFGAASTTTAMKVIRALPSPNDNNKNMASPSFPSFSPASATMQKINSTISTIFQFSKCEKLGYSRTTTATTATTTCTSTTTSAANNHINDSSDENVYDNIIQIIAHLIRDWTVVGRPIRQSLYDWCQQQLDQQYGCYGYECDNDDHDNRDGDVRQNPNFFLRLPVLVPGAGLGRLAYDLAVHGGYSVEANEISPVMASAAHGVFQQINSNRAKGWKETEAEEEQPKHQTPTENLRSNNTETNRLSKQNIIYPFIMDYMSNEVDSKRRFDGLEFPDFIDATTITTTTPRSKLSMRTNGSLSYTIGDWMGPYYQSLLNHFGAIVTCFVLDTSTNVLQTIHHIARLLVASDGRGSGSGSRAGGVWINVGPVQWHGNAQLRPSVDELYEMILSTDLFDIVHWSVDVKPIPYRHVDDYGTESSFVRTTHWEAYRPLRFVAVRRQP